ncbi:MAG: hypothetical protein ACHQ01_07095 [Candidatus Limnocylindrales bacterium]
MTSQPRAFFALDLGSATTSGAVLGHVGGRWRLVAHTAAPSYVEVDALLRGLLAQIELTDSEMLAELAAGEPPDVHALVASWPRLVARTTPARRIAVLAGSRRQRRRLEDAALGAGWLVVGGSADEDDPIALSRLALSAETHAVLLGADRSPAGDEKRHLPDLAALLAAVAGSRPELTVVLAGGAASYDSSFATLTESRSSQELPTSSGTASPGGSLAEPFPAAATPQTKKVSQKAAAIAPPGAVGEGAEGVGNGDGVSAGDRRNGGAGRSGSGGPALASAADPSVAGQLSLPAVATARAPRTAEDRAAARHVLLAPDAEAGQPAGSSLRQVLEGLRAASDDSRLGVARSISSLASVLDRAIEVVEIGLQGGLRARSEPIAPSHLAVTSFHTSLADASFAPPKPSEEVIDGLLAWSTIALDRHRAMDRLNDLRLTPWGEADGDGAVFRLAAAKGAFARLVAATPEIDAKSMPDLLVVAGGIFAALPPSVVALAMADLVRRPGVAQLACDQARLLGPLGVIEDEMERRRMMANLADDILMPLGSLILPAGLRQGRSAGYLRMKSAESSAEIELHPGSVQVVDLPPGRAAKAGLDFRDAVRLGTRSHHFTVEVGGGLGGLLIDLRDIPMRISDRPDSRRAALEAWQRGMWPELDE